MAKKSTLPSERLSGVESRRQLSFLLSLYKPFAFRAVVSLVFMTLTASVGLLFPRLTGGLLDAVLHPDTVRFSAGEIALGLLSLIALQSIIRYIFSVQLTTITEKVVAQLRTHVFEHLVRLPMSFFAERRVGELGSRLTADLTQIQETFGFTSLEILRQTVFLFGGIIFIMTQSLQLAVPILTALPVLITAAVLFGRRIRKHSTKTQDALAHASTVVEESLQAIASVKSYRNEQYESSRYGTALHTSVHLAILTAKMRSAFVSFILFAFFGSISGVLWYGASLIDQQKITFGDFATFLMYAMFVGGAMGSFAELLSQVQRALGAAVRVQEILNETAEHDDFPHDTLHSAELRSLRFDHVTFAYPSRPDINVLNDISLSVEAGQRVAFVGESGAGKSTMAALIQRLYAPQKGTITFNSLPSDSLPLGAIRQAIGIVPQDITLFGGTIRDNILYGNLHANDEQLWQAATLANAADFIRNFPEGMETIVGERGVKLSGGQRQRIAIARAILKNPPILILDEATSSLDSESEQLIQQALERLMSGRTTIIIAHRLSTIRQCDNILVFAKGSIIESGTHEELIALGGKYASLCALQFVE